MSELALAVPRPAPAALTAAARRPYAVLLLLCLIAWLPGFATLPVLDRDEARFAQASKQMVETGNWIDIRFGSEARYKKPIGIYWLEAASTELFGSPPYKAIWTYRLPSLLGATVTVFLAFWCFSAMAPPAAALVGAGLLALTLGLSVEAHIAKTDAVLLAAVLGAQGVLIRFYLAARDVSRARPEFALAMAGWAAMAVGVLVKGPVIFAVLALTAIAVSLWDREWRWLGTLHPRAGIALLLVLVLPWFVAIGIASHGAFYSEALGHDFAGKIAGGEESHGAPPGYYILLSTFTLWPATLFALPGIGAAVSGRKDAGMRFLLGWAGANWLMFELVPTKLPHYILPAYPALAMMAALWLMQGEEKAPRHALRWIALVQFAIGALVLAAAVAVGPDLYGPGAPSRLHGLAQVFALIGRGAGTPAWLDGLAALVASVGLGAATLMAIRARFAALVAAGMAALILYPTLMWAVAPRLDAIWVSPRIAALVGKDSRPGDPAVVAAGYDEPSLIFLLGTKTRISSGSGAADIAVGEGGLALIEEHEKRAFLGRIVDLGAEARAVDRLTGINYSRGRPVAITIYRVLPLPRAASRE